MRISDWSSDVCSSRSELHRDLRERVGLFLHRFGIAAVDRGLGVGDRRFDLTLERGVDLVAMLGQLAFGGVDQAFGVVLRFGRSEERRVGNECVSTCRSRWSPSI